MGWLSDKFIKFTKNNMYKINYTPEYMKVREELKCDIQILSYRYGDKNSLVFDKFDILMKLLYQDIKPLIDRGYKITIYGSRLGTYLEDLSAFLRNEGNYITSVNYSKYNRDELYVSLNPKDDFQRLSLKKQELYKELLTEIHNYKGDNNKIYYFLQLLRNMMDENSSEITELNIDEYPCSKCKYYNDTYTARELSKSYSEEYLYDGPTFFLPRRN